MMPFTWWNERSESREEKRQGKSGSGSLTPSDAPLTIQTELVYFAVSALI